MNTNRLAVTLTVINLILLIVVLAQSRMIANQTIPEVLRVRAFELVDENGRVRAQLNINLIQEQCHGRHDAGLLLELSARGQQGIPVVELCV